VIGVGRYGVGACDYLPPFQGGELKGGELCTYTFTYLYYTHYFFQSILSRDYDYQLLTLFMLNYYRMRAVIFPLLIEYIVYNMHEILRNVQSV